jgi:hypothetical protein
MSYFDDASLVMIPSGYKTSKVYSVKPTDGSGDLAFTRSNDTATRVGPDGLIEKVRTNLLLQSNSFDTTWTNFNTTDTGGQSGYDGTNDAWLLQNTATSGSIRQTISASGVQTYSFYAKAGTTDWVAAYVAGSIIPYCFFDLTNGVKGATQNNVINSNITAVGNGWYRIAIAFNNTTTDVRIFPAEANAVLASQVGDNIYIQNAQLEAGDIATEPILTTTAAVSVGPVANVPRLDYLNSSCPRLLLEPQRVNLALFSESLDNAYWTNAEATTVSANVGVSPDGYTNADKLIPQATSNLHRLSRSFTVTTATPYTFSAFVKRAEGTVMVEYNQSLIGQSATRRIFALSDGTTSNRITAYISSSNGIEFYVRNSGGDLFLGSAASPIGNTKAVHKIAAAYKNGDYAVYLDGVLIISGAGTAGTIPACSRFDLGNQLGSNDLYEPMMQALLFPTRLSNVNGLHSGHGVRSSVLRCQSFG